MIYFNFTLLVNPVNFILLKKVILLYFNGKNLITSRPRNATFNKPLHKNMTSARCAQPYQNSSYEILTNSLLNNRKSKLVEVFPPKITTPIRVCNAITCSLMTKWSQIAPDTIII